MIETVFKPSGVFLSLAHVQPGYRHQGAIEMFWLHLRSCHAFHHTVLLMYYSYQVCQFEYVVFQLHSMWIMYARNAHMSTTLSRMFEYAV